MCHVPPIDSWQGPSSFRRFGASNGATPGPIGPAVRALFPKTLGHTYWLTDRQTRPANYFSPTHQWKSSYIERSMLKHLNVHSLRFWISAAWHRADSPPDLKVRGHGRAEWRTVMMWGWEGVLGTTVLRSHWGTFHKTNLKQAEQNNDVRVSTYQKSSSAS